MLKTGLTYKNLLQTCLQLVVVKNKLNEISCTGPFLKNNYSCHKPPGTPTYWLKCFHMD